MAPTSKAPSRSTRVQKRNLAGMHLRATLPRPQRQPRPSNTRPHSALFSATAPRPGRGAVRCVPSMIDSLEVKVLCAGINRHEEENVRVSRERISDLLGPEFCTKRREAFSEG